MLIYSYLCLLNNRNIALERYKIGSVGKQLNSFLKYL